MSGGGDLNDNDNNITKDMNELHEDDTESSKMQKALTAIALEIQSFNDSTCASSQHLTDNEEIFNKLIKCKWMLKSKNEHIKQLKTDIKTACVVAKTVISAKDNEATTLNSHLNFIRSDCADLNQKHQDTSQVIQSLAKENKALRNELDNLANFIELGFKELQNIRNEKNEELSILMQLKKIIVCCGQYYADYCNEYNKNVRLEQKNRFLNNKLIIMNNNFEATTHELKSLRYHNMRLLKENDFLKGHEKKSYKKPVRHSDVSYSDYKICDQNDIVNLTTTKVEFLTKIRNLDLSTHLSIVQKLLFDQDELLKDLKNISSEVGSSEIVLL